MPSMRATPRPMVEKVSNTPREYLIISFLVPSTRARREEVSEDEDEEGEGEGETR